MTKLVKQWAFTDGHVQRHIHPHAKSFQQHGRSLIELLIGMLIAIIALGAIVTAITNTSLTGEQQNVQAQINEEAALASALISKHFRMAGSSTPFFINAGPNAASRNFQGPALRGCDGGLANPAGVYSFTAPPPNPCNGGNGSDAVTVLYEATLDNTNPNALNLPTDCVGTGILATQPSDAPGGPLYSLAENRFYIDPLNNALMCRGSGNAAAQALINNVLDMQVTYGVSNVVNTGSDFISGFETTAYLTATQVDALPAQGSVPPWNRVISARICLLIFSEPNALSERMQNYIDCNNNVVVPAANDRRLFRQVNIFVSARNQAAPCANTVQVAAAAGPARQDLCTPPVP